MRTKRGQAPNQRTTLDGSATVGAMPLPDSLTPYETLRGIEATLTFTATQLDELLGTQPDTALEGMLLSALAAVTGARASLADVRLNWDDLCSPEDQQHPQVLAEALQQAEEARVASLAGLAKLDEEVELALVEIDAGEVGIARRRLIAATQRSRARDHRPEVQNHNG